MTKSSPELGQEERGMDVQGEVIRILAEQAMLEQDDINLSDSLGELGIDSLGVVETIFAIEETFEVSVPFNANEPEKSDFDISSVEKIVGAVTALVENKPK